MTNEKKGKKNLPKLYNVYNEGKYGKIEIENLNADFLLNKRVVSDEQFSTIKFVGNLPGSTGIWLGLDWDDKTRGRHNGEFKGVKYFDTWTSNSGSFIRPNKVSLGLTLEEALQIRYGDNENMDLKYNFEDFFLESSDSDDECGTSGIGVGPPKSHFNHQKVKVDFIGAGSNAFNVCHGQMDRIRSAVLHSLPVFGCISEENGGGKLNDLVPQLEELDVAQTLLTDWKEIAKICVQLPKLKQLNVSDNKLQLYSLRTDDTENDKLFQKAFQNITYLVLVRIGYSWEAFCKIFNYFPFIEHLCLAYNKLSSLQPIVHSNFHTLTYIDLACNEIDDFENVLPFGYLKTLETLFLNENKIENIVLPGDVTKDCDLFPKLKLLAISNNLISTWNSVHHLSRLKSLKELIFMFNPILEKQKNAETARQDVIAKMHRIKIFNRNEIKYEERKGAEIDYLKRYGKLWLETVLAEGDSENVKEIKLANTEKFLEEHPRFLKLVEIYGAPEQSEVKEVNRILKEKLIEVTFEIINENESSKLIKKKIPSHMTVQQIRSLVRRLFKIPNRTEFNLCYISNSRPDLEIPLEADTREIGFYNVEAGDRVIIHLES